MRTKRTFSGAFFGIIALILFYALNYFMPMRADDYWFNFIISPIPGKGVSFTMDRIETIKDLLESCYWHRYALNGRLSDCLATCVQYVGGKGLFNVLNTVMAAASVYLMLRIYAYRFTLLSVSTIILLAFCMLPALQGTILWLSGACNYLWGIPLILLVIYTKQFLENSPPRRSTLVLFAVFCFLASAMHEALGIALTGTWALLLTVKFLKKEKNYRLISVALIISLIGATIPLSAEGIWRRAGTRVFFSLYEWVRNYTLLCFNAIVPTVILMVVLSRKKITIFETFEGCFAISNLAVAGIFGASGGWGGGYFYYAFAVMLLSLSTFRHLNLPEKKATITGYANASIALILLCAWLNHQITWNNSWNNIIERAKNEEIIVLSPEELQQIDIKDLASSFPLFNKTYMTPYMSSMLNVKELSIIPNEYMHARAEYEALSNSPEDKLASICTENMSIVRLPLGYSYENNNDSFIRNSNGEVFYILLCVDPKPEILRNLNDKYVRRQKHKKCSVDYYKGHFYLIINTPDTLDEATIYMKNLKSGTTEEVSISFNN